MLNLSRTRLFYLLAFLTIAVWSSTFISTKVLLQALSPLEIILYRFIIAYFILFIMHPHFHKPENPGTELMIFLAGIFGGSLYFLGENYAILYSSPANVALIVSTAPIFTIIASRIFLKTESITKQVILGACIAFTGVALVIFNGTFILKINPKGDFLALAAALSWAFYSICVKKINSSYSQYYITRKIFFWTILTALPIFMATKPVLHLRGLLNPEISINLFVLSFLASAIAYGTWNRCLKALGASRVSNMIFFIPLLTLIESSIILGETFTIYAIFGAALIFCGVTITSLNRKKQ